MLLNTLKNENLKKKPENPLEARFYWFLGVFLVLLDGVFNASSCCNANENNTNMKTRMVCSKNNFDCLLKNTKFKCLSLIIVHIISF